MEPHRRRALVWIVAGTGVLAACVPLSRDGTEGAGEGKPVPAHPLSSLTDWPLPGNYTLDDRNSIVLGEGDRWTGRLSYDVTSGPQDLLAFYQGEAPAFGWKQLTVFRGRGNVLTLVRGSRIATMLITPGSLFMPGTSRVEVVVSEESGALPGQAGPAPYGGVDGAVDIPGFGADAPVLPY